MEQYSVEEVSKLAKISVRTLHYYDEINLLKPAFRLKNGRRFYGNEEFLILIDIIFFKDLGFSLKKIKSILAFGNKDKKAMLISKKQFLKNEIKRIKELIKSIDVTLEFYYKGENKNYNAIIKQFELFQKTAKEYKHNFEREFGNIDDEETKKIKKMSFHEKEEFTKKLYKNVDMKLYKKRINSCFTKLVEAIEANLKEDSKKVQNLMKEFYETLDMIGSISKKKWLRIGVSLSEDKSFYTLYAKMHPKLPEFLSKAIKIYGDNL